MSEDCYFYIDKTEQDVPDHKQKISPLCVSCKEEHFPGQNVGWFWQAEQGYGPWVFKCNICGHIIHDPDQEEYEEIETTN